MGAYADEFPMLGAVGLCVVETAGNGNCLFNALSDQIYGSQNSHNEIRARVIEYMREHAEEYKGFINVNPGGGQRRNPKRKNAGGFSSTGNEIAPPSQADIDRGFKNHLKQMAQGGTYGDNMEIAAFSAAYGYQVNVHQREFIMVVNRNPQGSNPPVAHIAYHTWEHYSSVRNIDGPLVGLPCIVESPVSPATAKAAQAKVAAGIEIQPWMISTCLNSLPFQADHATIHKTLQACKGDVNAAVSRLIESNEERFSNSGNSQGSSSVERDVDSDDESEYTGAKKKQDRRLSRATRTVRSNAAASTATTPKQPKLTIVTKSKTEGHIPPTPATADFPKRTSSYARRAPRRIIEDSDDEYKEDDGSSAGNSPASTSMTSKSPTPETKLPTASTAAPLAGGVKLRLSQPKAPAAIPTSTPAAAPAPTRYQGTARPNASPRPKLSARDRKDLKKAAQKTAAKDRKKPGAKASVAVNAKGVKKEYSPGVDLVIKTLYI